MKCFTHQERDAVGTCKSCGKGLCPDCAVDLTKGLACRNRCEQEVEKIISLIDQNTSVGTNIMKNMKRSTYFTAFFYMACGFVFLLAAVGMGKITEIPGLIGILFLLYGGYVLWRGLRIPKRKR